MTPQNRRLLTKKTSCAALTAIVAGALAFQAGTASAINFSFAGYSWEQDNTPDVLGLLGNSATLGGATFSSGLPQNITQSVGFIALSGSSGSGFVAAPGFNPNLSLGKQATAQHGLLQTDSTASVFSSAINLPAGNNGSTTRHGISVSWSGGRSLLNGAGSDFVLYESGSNATSPEGQIVRAHLTGGGYSPWYYRSVDAFATYVNTPATTEGAFATAFDLSALGIANGALIDEIQIANLRSADRINTVGTFALNGEVVFSDPSGTLARASVGNLAGLNASSTFASGGLDPDPLYVGIMGTLVVPEPTAAALCGLGALLLWRRKR